MWQALVSFSITNALHQSFPYTSVVCVIGALQLQIIYYLKNIISELRVGWLEFNIPCQHEYSYIRDEVSYSSQCH